MSKSAVFPLLAAGVVGFIGYLAFSGVTLQDVRNWVHRQVGNTKVDAADIKSMPAGGYAPIVPGR